VGPLDQSFAEAQAGAQKAFAARHLAGIGFVIVASQVEQTMENEDLDLDSQGVALAAGLAEGGRHADGEIAGYFLENRLGGRKGEHVGGFVLTAKLAIEAADGGVGGEQDGDASAETHGVLGAAEEAAEGACGRQAEFAGRLCGVSRKGPLRRRCAAGEVWVQIWVDKDHSCAGLRRGEGPPSF
jgi:hypothetical protein